MKRVLLVVVVGAIAYAGYQRVHSPDPLPRPPAAEQDPGLQLVERPELPEGSTSSESPGFRCDGRVYCSQMKSCDEAKFFLRNCLDVKMDGDRDGKPCEDWCGH